MVHGTARVDHVLRGAYEQSKPMQRKCFHDADFSHTKYQTIKPRISSGPMSGLIRAATQWGPESYRALDKPPSGSHRPDVSYCKCLRIQACFEQLCRYPGVTYLTVGGSLISELDLYGVRKYIQHLMIWVQHRSDELRSATKLPYVCVSPSSRRQSHMGSLFHEL